MVHKQERNLANGRWFRVDYLTNLMRKIYRFRMVGKALYCQPKRRESW